MRLILKTTKTNKEKCLVVKPLNRSLGHVQVGYSDIWETGLMDSVVFQPLKFRPAVQAEIRIVDSY